MKHCVQFLIDTILNLTIVHFFVKKKGDELIVSAISYLRKRDTRL
jgi:hypothetical protein